MNKFFASVSAIALVAALSLSAPAFATGGGVGGPSASASGIGIGSATSSNTNINALSATGGAGGGGGAGGAGGSGTGVGIGGSSSATGGNSGGNTQSTSFNNPYGVLSGGTVVSAPGNVAIGGECHVSSSGSFGIGVGVIGLSGGAASSKPTMQCDLQKSYSMLMHLKGQFGGYAVLIDGGYTIDQLLLNIGSQMVGVNNGKAPVVQASAPARAPAMSASVNPCAGLPASQCTYQPPR